MKGRMFLSLNGINQNKYYGNSNCIKFEKLTLPFIINFNE